MPLRAVIFDFDDTLIDWLETQKAYYRFFAGKYLSNQDPEEVVHKLLAFSDRGRRSVMDWGLEAIEHWRLPLSGEELTRERRALMHRFTVSREGMEKTLAYLRPKYRMGIITNGESEIQHRRIDALGIPRYFDAVIASGDVGINKPDARIFSHCLEALNVRPEEAVMVGDDYTNDIRGALGAGIAAIRLRVEGYEDGLGSPGVPEIWELPELKRLL